MSLAGPRYPAARADAPLVVFDFDHTLYDGDSGSHLIRWMIRRSPWLIGLFSIVTSSAARRLLAIHASSWLSRRHRISPSQLECRL